MSQKLDTIFFCGLLLGLVVFILCWSGDTCWAKKTLNVGAAGVLIYPLQEIAQIFQEQTGHKVRLCFNASESLAQEIRRGKRYDVFFSADHKRPEELANKGLCYPPKTYAYGVLILWGKNPEIGMLGWPGALFVNSKIALPNPKLGPYGAVAKLVLVKERLWENIKDRIVIASTVCEAFLKVKRGEVEASFASLSLVLGNSKLKGGYIVVPHAPLIEQKACVVKGPNKDLARQFLDFVLSPKGQKILRRYGYF